MGSLTRSGCRRVNAVPAESVDQGSTRELGNRHQLAIRAKPNRGGERRVALRCYNRADRGFMGH